MTITANSYFSGAGLMDAGLVRAGVIINQAFEIDKPCIKTYRKNFGNHINHTDITQELVLDQAESDFMVFTYPCTKYSPIGDIHGVRTGDELFLHALRHIAVRKPEGYVVENVPGMKAFPIVMEAMTILTSAIQHFCS